jgi:TRAP transporter TAXI family solute receptor
MKPAACSCRVSTSLIFERRSDSSTSRFSSPGMPKMRSTPSFSSAATSRSEAAFAAEPHWPSSLTLGTASPGGTYYAYGEGLARILTRALGLPVTMRPTEGPSENIQLLEAGEIQLAFVTQGVALQAWNGTGGWTGGKQLRAMRAMFPMYDTPFQFVVRQDAGIGSIAELAGKRVGVGPRGGTTATYMPEFLKALKLEATLVHGDWADLAAQATDRTLRSSSACCSATSIRRLGER